MKLARLLLLLVPAAVACCADDGARAPSGATAEARAAARVTGTLLDAATGAPVVDVRVRGPRDTSSRSDERGRFALEGLRAGDEGEVVAEAGDGRRASLHLRPLKPGTLEVVLHLVARPRDD